MKTSIENGKVAIINETKEEAIATFTEMMEEIGVKVTPQIVRDFGIQGGETNSELQQWVMDYSSELQSERAEAAAFKRHPESIDPVNY